MTWSFAVCDGIVGCGCGLLSPVFAGWALFAVLCEGLGASGNVYTIPLTAYIQETVDAEKMIRKAAAE